MSMFSKIFRRENAGQSIPGELNIEHTIVLEERTNECKGYLEIATNGHIININKNTFVVGRLAECCDYAFSNNKISKIHATFVFKDGNAYIVDQNSTNGTYINGATKRINSNIEYCIIDGDMITLGNEELIFRIGRK